MDFNTEEETIDILSKTDDSPKLAIIVFIALFVALLPALIMWKGLQSMDSDESE
jgi:hypothetical protein